MDVKTIKIADIAPAPYNPRKKLKPGDKEYDKLKHSIVEFGYVEPIIFNERTGRVVGGHQRLQVLTDLGRDEVDCVVVDMDDSHEKALNIALNKISGEWDIPMLKDLMVDLDASGFNLGLTGFGIDEIANMLANDEPQDDGFDVDDTVKNIVDPKTKPGDVYIMGGHRLLCGDSTQVDAVNKLMNGELADQFLTDPPYNVNYTGKTKDALKIENDLQDADSFRQFLSDCFINADTVLKPGAVFYIWHADSEGLTFRLACESAGWTVRQCLVWNKNSMVMGRQDYHWKHEPCLYGWKDGASHLWATDRKQTTVLDFDRPTKNKEHPTMKPIPLIAYLIKNNTKGADLVLDLFGGSGSTLIACEETGRRCFMMELDPKYCDVIVKRWETLTGKKAVLAEVN